MRKIVHLSLVAVLLVATAGCIEEQELTVDDPPPKDVLIVESRISRNGPGQVVLTALNNPASLDVFPQLSGARFTLSDDEGEEEVLQAHGFGHYRSWRMLGQPGRTYNLLGVLGSIRISGASTMPGQSLIIEKANYRPVPVNRGILEVQFQFPPAEPVFGWARLAFNGVPAPGYHFYQAEPGSGSRWEIPTEVALKPGDLIRLEFFQAEESVYAFFQALDARRAQSQAEELIAAPPAGLVANLTADEDIEVLGYFAAVVVESRVVRVE